MGKIKDPGGVYPFILRNSCQMSFPNSAFGNFRKRHSGALKTTLKTTLDFMSSHILQTRLVKRRYSDCPKMTPLLSGRGKSETEMSTSM